MRATYALGNSSCGDIEEFIIKDFKENPPYKLYTNLYPGFDIKCIDVALKLDIPYVCVVPTINHSYLNRINMYRYQLYLENADEIYLIEYLYKNLCKGYDYMFQFCTHAYVCGPCDLYSYSKLKKFPVRELKMDNEERDREDREIRENREREDRETKDRRDREDREREREREDRKRH